MTEGWVDCPSLGPGWLRREVLRKHADKPGRSDTYYISPRGEKIRSRVELMRLLGCSRDLTDFDFKKGIFLEPGAEVIRSHLPSGEGYRKVPIKRSKKCPPTLADAIPPLKKPPYLQEFEPPLDQKPPKLELELPIGTPASIPPQQPELLASVDQLTPKPPKRRYRKHPPPIVAAGKTGDAMTQEILPEETVVRCASCQGKFPGAMFPSQRRCRWLCPECRARRRDFNREQRYYKQVGCGVCQACQMSQDCGICSVCVVRAKSPELHVGIKCLLRRCLKIVKKGLECGLCQACKITEDCGNCNICMRRKNPGMKRQWKCVKRRCLKRKKKIPPKKDGYNSKKLTVKWKPSMERDPGGVPTVRHRKKQLGTMKERKKVGRPPKHPTAKLSNSVRTSTSRQNRKCGECEACQLKTDCGRCDFCCDKPKFGGRNLKRQKCRWRQCLHFAMAEDLPSANKPIDLSKPKDPAKLHQQPLKLREEAENERAHDSVEDSPIPLQQVREELEAPRRPAPPTQVLVKESDTRLPAVNLLLATSPKIKQDCAEPGGDHRPSRVSPVLAGLPQPKSASGTQDQEVVVLDDEEDDEVEQLQQIRPPVIMEIYSLGGVRPLNQLDRVLREFLAELNEIPLPANWEVLPLVGSPNLRLVQRSKRSTMSAAVIHIRPGLFFHVVVRDLPVPPEHELYARHPACLTTVDEVVELIGDLEAYRLCPGWPAGWHGGERSQACDVLVYSGCCPQCQLNPWPSGSGTH